MGFSVLRVSSERIVLSILEKRGLMGGILAAIMARFCSNLRRAVKNFNTINWEAGMGRLTLPKSRHLLW